MIGRSAAELERGEKILGAVLVLVAAAGTLVVAVRGPTALAVAFPVLGFGAALLGLVVKVQRGRIEEREEREAGWRLGRLLRMREVVEEGLVYELGIDTEAPESLELLGLSPGEHPDYLRRRIDGTIRDRLREAGARDGASLIVVSGPSKAGKSRTLLEVAYRVLRDAWLIAPKNAEAVAKLARSRPPREVGDGACVIWVDDIEAIAQRDRGLNTEAMRAFGEWDRPVVVLATQGGKGIELAGDSAHQFREVVSDLLARYRPIPLEPALEDSEIETVRDRYPADAAGRIASEGLGEFMIAAPRLVDRLRNGDSSAGKAIAWAAIDCQRAGLLRPLNVAQLEAFYGYYLAGPATADRFVSGLEWAAEPLYSTVALMSRSEGSLDEYRPHNYLVDWARQQGQALNGAAWDRMLSDHAEGADELLRMGTVAHQGGDVARAERAWLRADDHGSGPAAANLGWLCEERKDLEGAEKAYRRADQRGDGHGAGSLGRLLEGRDDLEGAEAAFRRSDDRGDPQGACWYGHFLHTRLKDLPGAEAAFRRAVARGHWHGASQLGRVLEDKGDLEGAEAAFREADQYGDAVGSRRLGIRLELSDDLAGAEAAYARADERGDGYGAGKLASLLERRGEYEAAVAAYRRAESRGDSFAAAQLGKILRGKGDLAAAEAVYRRLHQRGEGIGSFYLGHLLWDRGEVDEAEAIFREGIRQGSDAGVDMAVSRGLGQLLRLKGDRDGAELAFRDAGAMGDPLALLHLVEMLEERGAEESEVEKEEEVAAAAESARAACEKLAIEGDENGDMTASYVLGRLRQRGGDLDGAEAAYRRADERGSLDGTVRLASLLLYERRSAVEGLAVYQRADERGHTHAPYYVGILLRARGDRAEALQALMRADMRGSSPGALELGKMLLEEAEGSEPPQRAMEALDRALQRALSLGNEDVVAMASEAIQRARSLQA